MMRTLLPLCLLLSSPCLGPPFAVQGQSIPSPYRHIERGQEAGLFVGTFSAATGQFDLGPKSGLLIGGRYAVELGGPVFLEGMASLLPTTRDIIDPRRVEGDRSIGEADVSLVAIDVRFGFSLTGRRTWNGLSPYIFAGGGLAFDGASRADLEEALLPEDRFEFGTSFTTGFGGGVRYAISQALILRSDLGLNLWKLSTPTGFDDPTKNLGAVPEDAWVGGWGFTLGASWRF
ncbi:MAG: hypothetical protein OEO23_09240 [Gemmatimonadota bacterium]|nr:hypothetical protein [Gemmatimonadota bacterium]